jgi:hypothetical protein
MAAVEYLSEKITKSYDYIKWAIYNTYPQAWFQTPFHLILRRERGTDFPFYFQSESRFVHNQLHSLQEFIDNLVHCHELERNNADFEQNLPKRFNYFVKNFHIYSNDTMANLYFGEKLPLRDYQRIKSNYNFLFASWFGYNILSGACLVALNNHFFRLRTTSLPLIFLAFVTTGASLGLNYELSYQLMEKSLNFQIRRLGHGHLIHNKGSRYPRSVDFFAF